MREAGETSKADMGLVGVSCCIRLIWECGLRNKDCGWHGVCFEAAVGSSINELDRVGGEEDRGAGAVSGRNVVEGRARHRCARWACFRHDVCEDSQGSLCGVVARMVWRQHEEEAS